MQFFCCFLMVKNKINKLFFSGIFVAKKVFLAVFHLFQNKQAVNFCLFRPKKIKKLFF